MFDLRFCCKAHLQNGAVLLREVLSVIEFSQRYRKMKIPCWYNEVIQSASAIAERLLEEFPGSSLEIVCSANTWIHADSNKESYHNFLRTLDIRRSLTISFQLMELFFSADETKLNALHRTDFEDACRFSRGTAS